MRINEADWTQKLRTLLTTSRTMHYRPKNVSITNTIGSTCCEAGLNIPSTEVDTKIAHRFSFFRYYIYYIAVLGYTVYVHPSLNLLIPVSMFDFVFY